MIGVVEFVYGIQIDEILANESLMAVVLVEDGMVVTWGPCE